MKTYFTVYKYSTYYMLFFSLFFGFLAFIGHNPVSIFIFTLNFFLWVQTYNYLKKQTQKAFIVSFILVNILWLPLLYRTITRVLFMFENGGMERADGYGSPMAFLLGLIFEQIFFIPLTILVMSGLYFILLKRKTICLTTT